MLERESRRLGVPLDNKLLNELAQHYNTHSTTDLYAGIGFGDISVLSVIHELTLRQQKTPNSRRWTNVSRASRSRHRANKAGKTSTSPAWTTSW